MAERQYFMDGYAFATKEEYNIAMREKRNINSIRAKMDMNNKDSVLIIYRKLAGKRLLISPVGIAFMRELRTHLIEDFHVEETDIPMISVSSNHSMSSLDRSGQYTNQQLLRQIKEKNRTLTTLKIVIFGLLVIIVGMFVVTVTGDNSGYFDVENRVLDKYSSWEEELNQREKAVKEAEEKLGIDAEQKDKN